MPVPGQEQEQEQALALAREPGLVPERVPEPVPVQAMGRAPRPPEAVRSHLLLRRSPSARLLTTT